MCDEKNTWDKQKFLDEMIQAMYGTNLTFDEYYRVNARFRNTVDSIRNACQTARLSPDPDRAEKLVEKLNQIANEIRKQSATEQGGSV